MAAGTVGVTIGGKWLVEDEDGRVDMVSLCRRKLDAGMDHSSL